MIPKPQCVQGFLGGIPILKSSFGGLTNRRAGGNDICLNENVAKKNPHLMQIEQQADLRCLPSSMSSLILEGEDLFRTSTSSTN